MLSVIPKYENGSNHAHPHAQAVYNAHEPTKLSSTRDKTVHLEICGQGTVAVPYKRIDPPKNGSTGAAVCQILMKKKKKTSQIAERFSGHGQGEILKLIISNSEISLTGADSWRFNRIDLTRLNRMNLLYFAEPSRHIWVSLDKGRTCIKVGHGYMLASNTLVRFEPKNESERENVHSVFEKVERIQLGDTWTLAAPMKYSKLPVVRDPPPLIVPGDSFNLPHLEENRSTTVEWLPTEAVRLYSNIRGNAFQLTDQQIKHINYSINTKGCALYQKLEQKDKRNTASIDKKNSYIRVGLGSDVGDSVGHPFVLEIWPPCAESPIHSHGDAVAIIKVLHGSIEASYYNPLADENNEDQQPIKTVVLKKGDVTWMTPEFYQTHKLRNARDDTATITIQCYNYLGNDATHHEHFDYVSEIDRKMHQFRPRSDFSFQDMLNLVEGEYLRSNLAKKKGILC